MGSHQESDRVDIDGLPFPGTIVRPDEIYCSTNHHETDTFRHFRLKADENAIVDQASLPKSFQKRKSF